MVFNSNFNYIVAVSFIGWGIQRTRWKPQTASHWQIWSKSYWWLSGHCIMCPSGATCLHTDCCFSELAL